MLSPDPNITVELHCFQGTAASTLYIQAQLETDTISGAIHLPSTITAVNNHSCSEREWIPVSMQVYLRRGLKKT